MLVALLGLMLLVVVACWLLLVSAFGDFGCFDCRLFVWINEVRWFCSLAGLR